MEDIVKNEFVFYSKLARPMVLNLPESRDRILAAAWIRKLSDENVGDESLRTTYLKLLLFCLQRRRLSGIFADDPLLYEVLEDLASNIDLNKFARNLLKQERQDRYKMISQETREDIAAFPPFTTDCSSDLKEYVAVQNIPNFGVHAFYAISKQPINKWQHSELAIFPKGTKSVIDSSITITTAPVAPTGSASAPAVEKGADVPAFMELPSQEKKKRRSRKLGSSPPTRPIGQVKRATVERLTPTWGTNLVDIRGRTDIGRIKETSGVDEALEAAVSQIIEDEAAEEERKERSASRGAEHKSLGSKAKEMTYAFSEFKHGMMDKAKIQPPSRFAKLGDRSRLQDPRSPKGLKIKVKSTKKKVKGSKDFGLRPANPSEEFGDSMKKVLKEAGLTWQDLMSQEDNIDEELQQIEDEILGKSNDGEFKIKDLKFEGYKNIDNDAFCRETEADLDAHRTVYDKGVEEDEELIEWLQDQIEEEEEQQDIFREAEEMRRASPAISRGIPITTPQSVASPRRIKSAEKIYAEATDHLLIHRQSPSYPPKKLKRQIPIDQKPKRSKEPIGKVRGLLKVIEKTHKVAKAASKAINLMEIQGQHSTRDDSDQFAKLEKEFQQEISENRRNRSPKPSPSPYGTELRQRAEQPMRRLRSLGMHVPNYRKAGSTDEVVLGTNEKTVGNQYGVGALDAVRRNLFGSRCEAMEASEPTGVKRRNTHGPRHWEQEPELMQELHHQIDFLGVAENCMNPQQEEGGVCDEDFRQFMRKTPQMNVEEVVKQQRQSPQTRMPSSLRRETHSSSHEQPCMLCECPEEPVKFRRSQREMEQLSQLLPELEAQIEKTTRATWRDIEAIIMELYPTPMDKENEVKNVDVEFSGPSSPQNEHSTRISSGGLYSPGYVEHWEPCKIEQDDEYLVQTMQTGQGITLDDPHMYEFLGGYRLPESLSPRITKECEFTHRQVDKTMFPVEDDQSVDNEILLDYESPCTPCMPPPRHAKAMTANEERRRARDRLRQSSQQNSMEQQGGCPAAGRQQASASNTTIQSLFKIAEQTPRSIQQNAERRSVRRNVSYRKT